MVALRVKDATPQRSAQSVRASTLHFPATTGSNKTELSSESSRSATPSSSLTTTTLAQLAVIRRWQFAIARLARLDRRLSSKGRCAAFPLASSPWRDGSSRRAPPRYTTSTASRRLDEKTWRIAKRVWRIAVFFTPQLHHNDTTTNITTTSQLHHNYITTTPAFTSQLYHNYITKRLELACKGGPTVAAAPAGLCDLALQIENG